MDKMTKNYYRSRYYQRQKRYSKELAWAIAAQQRLKESEKRGVTPYEGLQAFQT